MTRSFVSVLAAAAGLVAGPAAAPAGVILDQEYVTGENAAGVMTNPSDPAFRRAMTFTVGVSGTLAFVETQTRGNATGLRLLAAAGGAPVSDPAGILLTAAGPTPAGGEYQRFDLSGFGFAVTAGDVFALEPLGVGGWTGTSPGDYPRGEGYYLDTGSGVDSFTPDGSHYHFRTFVETAAVPEPTGLTLLGGAAAGAFAARRRLARA